MWVPATLSQLGHYKVRQHASIGEWIGISLKERQYSIVLFDTIFLKRQHVNVQI